MALPGQFRPAKSPYELGEDLGRKSPSSRHKAFWRPLGRPPNGTLFSGLALLALQVSKGMTLEQLDQPPPGHEYIEEARTASRLPATGLIRSRRFHYNRDGEVYWTYPRPCMEYPPAKPYRNLAREWIAANPKEWERMNASRIGWVTSTETFRLCPLALRLRNRKTYPSPSKSSMSTEFIARAISEAATDLMPIDRLKRH